MPKAHHISRRDFTTVTVGVLGVIMGVAIGLPGIGYLISPALKKQTLDAWISLGPLESYPVDEPTLFSFTRTTNNGWEKTVNSYGVYVFRETDAETIVFSNLCTHLSCRVTWEDSGEEYICPCHDGRFDKQGLVTTGPPPHPMWRYETKVEEGNLFIQLREL